MKARGTFWRAALTASGGASAAIASALAEAFRASARKKYAGIAPVTTPTMVPTADQIVVKEALSTAFQNINPTSPITAIATTAEGQVGPSPFPMLASLQCVRR